MPTIKLTMPLPEKLTNWLQNVYPAWIQLAGSTFYDLVPFNSPKSPLHIHYADCAADLATSAIFQNLHAFLSLINEGRMILLDDGTLSSDSLDLLLETTNWPNTDMKAARMMRRPLDQENIGPLDFLMALAQAANLVTINDGRLAASPAGKRICEQRIDQSIVRSVFNAAFGKVNPRTLTKLAHPWVTEQTGIILWGLSITADVPRSVPELTRYCFVPPEKFLDKKFDTLEVYMRAVYLAPLSWFGLVTTSAPDDGAAHVHDLWYQKTPLFDRFFKFHFEPAQPEELPN